MTDIGNLIDSELPRLRRYARLLCHDSLTSESLVRDCVARALSATNGNSPGLNVRAWLFCQLRSVCLSQYGREIRLQNPSAAHAGNDWPGGLASNGTASNGTASNGTGPDDGADLGQLERALDSLPPEEREILVLVVVEGFRYSEAAQILKIPLSTVGSRLARARGELHRLVYGRSPLDPTVEAIE